MKDEIIDDIKDTIRLTNDYAKKLKNIALAMSEGKQLKAPNTNESVWQLTAEHLSSIVRLTELLQEAVEELEEYESLNNN